MHSRRFLLISSKNVKYLEMFPTFAFALFYTAWKVSKYGVFSVLSLRIRPNAGKYGPEKTPYLDTFYTVLSETKY